MTSNIVSIRASREPRVYSVIAVLFLILCVAAGETRAEGTAPAAVLQELKCFDQFGSVLYVAAHPDDENTALIAYLARGRDYRTAYLSITRGDGGQNVLGPQLGPELGVLRTQELLAARRLDGGQQFFTRAIDFGFSKDYRQTLKVWDKQEVLSDIVRVIRTFRPDVIVTRFSTVPGNTHGHHTASAILGLEAFKLAGDPSAFPEQLAQLKPWQAKRIFSNGFGIGLGGGGASSRPASQVVRMSITGSDPVSGLSFSELAGESRSMHKTQGFGNFVGGGRTSGRAEAFQLLAGEPASKDIMDGVDTTWARVSLPEIGVLADKLIANFNSHDLSANVPAILEIKKQLATASGDPIIDEKRRLLDHILSQCLGLDVRTTVADAEVVPGEGFTLHEQVTVNSPIDVKWVAVRYPRIGSELQLSSEPLTKGTPSNQESTQTLPTSTPISQPYWLREQGTPGMFRVDDPTLISRPEDPPVFPVEYVFEVGGQQLAVPDEPVAATESPNEKFPRRLQAIPAVSLKFASIVQLFAPGSQHSVIVNVTAHRPDSAGNLGLRVPAGWSVTPQTQPFRLGAVGSQVGLTFTVTAPADRGTATITADAAVGHAHFDNERIEIQYSHLPFVLLQPPARLAGVVLDLNIHSHTIGYIAGAGDETADALRQMGCSVTELNSKDFTVDRLKQFDAIVIGIRAFNLRSDLASHTAELFAYIEGGGTVIAQYNRPDGLKTRTIAPFDLTLSAQRVTDPDAVVTFLTPKHPALNSPNEITQQDFANWVQERGTYFPNHWDDHFTPILECSDAGEQPLKGALLIAQDGNGYFVYTGLTFFRQLPAGVPGAYRLMANLLSLGK
jgi:LmbE family N-acetylglucosaminyl deacetylase